MAKKIKIKMMKNLLLLLIVILATHCNTHSQVHFLTDKLKYEPTDSIKIKLINKGSESLVYVVGLEINIDNRWSELEGDILYRVPKGERWVKMEKNESITKSIVLPEYIIKNVKKNNAKLRFRLKYGESADHYSLYYSEPITIL